jgi:glycosyltransferase involved in cell wall biosynthesis
MHRKINIIALYNNNGVGYHRILKPMQKLMDYHRELFNVFMLEVGKSDKQPLPDLGTTPIDIIIFNTAIGLKEDDPLIIYLQLCLMKYNSKIVMDIDDYFEFGSSVIVSKDMKAKHAKQVPDALKSADYITTTTETFKNVLLQHNPNVKVFPNFYDMLDPQYTVTRKPLFNDNGECVVRLGFTSSAFHKEDFKQLVNVTYQLKKLGLSDRFKIVLAGYSQNKWYQDYEKILTSDYRIVSKADKRLLEDYSNTSIELKNYQRIPWLPTNEYMKAYNEFDVLVAPLKDTPFNSCKSQIKYVEAAAMGAVFVGSDTPAYNKYVERGVNGFLCKPTEWVATLSTLIDDWDYVVRSGFSKMAKVDAFMNYEAEIVTKHRKDFFLKIVDL